MTRICACFLLTLRRGTAVTLLALVALAAAAPAMGQGRDSTVAAPESLAQVVQPEAADAAAEVTNTAAPAEAPPPVFLVVPFVVMLLLIATGPVLYPHHWHKRYPAYALGLGLLVSAYYLAVLRDGTPILHAVEEYMAFIALLAALFVASGGILIQTDFAGTPRANTLLLLFGAVIANLIGTTGASMLLIRPFLRLNAGRIRPYHIAFFIFLVSNVGGALTPIGDPPLFLGFLRGVPFFWPLQHIWYIWLPTVLLIAAVFYVVDRRNHRAAARAVVPESEQYAESEEQPAPASLDVDVPTTLPGANRINVVGKRGLVWLALVIAAVFVDPNVLPGIVPDLHALHVPFGVREILLFGIAFAAYKTADRRALAGNGFTFEPIREVAWLFIGIFLTMQPALKLIALASTEHAAALTPTHFYFGTGVLSSVLDNAPTYLSFLAAAMAKFGLNIDSLEAVRTMATGTADGTSWHYVQAISVAAVFWGAMTYIGNGPNFMVKSIAEASDVEAPSFFGYIVRYAIPVLLPIYLLVWLVFFSGWIVPLAGPVAPILNP